MRLLLDTNVLSEVRRPRPNERVGELLRRVGSTGLFLSVLTLGEIRQGIELLPRGNKRRVLGAWLAGLGEEFADHILPVDVVVADRWGVLAAQFRRIGRPVPATDLLIAATALAHDLVLATRNVKDFAGTGVDLLDPWNDDLPD